MPKKISDLTEKNTLDAQDLFLVTDIEDGSMSVSGQTLADNLTDPNAVGNRISELVEKTSIESSDLFLIKTASDVKSISAQTLITDFSAPENVGTGQGIFAEKDGAALKFKSLKSEKQIQLTSDADSITIKNVTESSKPVSALEINWSAGFVFHKTVAVNSSFTFSNVEDGKVISLIINNNGASTITITLPSPIQAVSKTFTILAGKSTVCTFVSADSKIYSAATPNLSAV